MNQFFQIKNMILNLKKFNFDGDEKINKLKNKLIKKNNGNKKYNLYFKTKKKKKLYF